ncbi:DUF1517 domain-containing protein [Thermocoleostomius sinensis]|jgi:hypothetical protein|uniref:DUF1517 domain-containing protein n=1 Tax=Thermocoleostomius sinensis A174 TaxID=2016057 RepID=A0A9E8ZCF3_9CYAN|nr:DUF1517 domain-containing protein [Thermocoleostomius sinensis]WAL60700.1 DUF1517 domain-containing protein [Thermocoleostomius sinensis A174]
MTSWRDRLNRMSGKTRIVVCRLFVHLAGNEVAPLLGVLNQSARQAVADEGDLHTLGEGLVEICQALLEYETYWRSAANEGEVFWDEGEAGDYVTELFTDSAQRYGSGLELETDDQADLDATLTLPITQNLVLMLTVAYEGEVPALETDLANMTALKIGLKALMNLHYDDRLRAIQVHFSPAQIGDRLTDDQLLQHYPELIPL